MRIFSPDHVPSQGMASRRRAAHTLAEVRARLEGKIDRAIPEAEALGACMSWTAAITPSGGPTFVVGGRTISARRAMYELATMTSLRGCQEMRHPNGGAALCGSATCVHPHHSRWMATHRARPGVSIFDALKMDVPDAAPDTASRAHTLARAADDPSLRGPMRGAA